MIMQAKKHRSVPFAFDDLVSPKGIAVSMNLSVRLKEAMDSVIRELQRGDSVVALQIASDRDLAEEIHAYLDKQAN